MAKIIKSLTLEQKAKFPEYVDKWTRIGLCTDPADRTAAESGIIEAYKIVGLIPPKIVWCDSPISMALTRAIVLQCGDEIKKRVAASVGDSVRASVGDSVAASVGDSVWASVGDSVGDSVWDSVRASVGDSVWASVRASVRDSVWASVWDSVGDSVGDSVRASVGDSGYGQHDANWIGFYEYFRHELNLIQQTDKLQGLQKITENAGWFLPHKDICWVSERHCIVMQDDRRRLHCDNGPAVSYPDGWAIYAWHGVRVPAWVIDHPQDITVEKIENEANTEIRRVMINRYGAVKYLQDSGAQEIHRDRDTKEERILYRKELDGQTIQMVKVINSTPEPDGSKKEYFLRVPLDVKTGLEAVAWTFNMKPEDYRPTVET